MTPKVELEQLRAERRAIMKIVGPLYNNSLVETVDRLDQQVQRLLKERNGG